MMIGSALGSCLPTRSRDRDDDRNRACASLIRMDDAVRLDNVAVSHRRSNDGEPAETQRTRARASSDWHEPIVVQNIAVRK